MQPNNSTVIGIHNLSKTHKNVQTWTGLNLCLTRKR
jgi:hypothetical protein